MCDNSVRPLLVPLSKYAASDETQERPSLFLTTWRLAHTPWWIDRFCSIVMLINLNTWNFSSIQETFILGIINSGYTLHAFEERPLFVSSISTEDIISIEDTVLVLQKIAACFVQILIKFCVYTDINKIQNRYYFKRF